MKSYKNDMFSVEEMLKAFDVRFEEKIVDQNSWRATCCRHDSNRNTNRVEENLIARKWKTQCNFFHHMEAKFFIILISMGLHFKLQLYIFQLLELFLLWYVCTLFKYKYDTEVMWSWMTSSLNKSFAVSSEKMIINDDVALLLPKVEFAVE